MLAEEMKWKRRDVLYGLENARSVLNGSDAEKSIDRPAVHSG